MAPVLSCSRALEMQDALIKRLSDPVFQEMLRLALLDVEDDPVEQMKVRHELCIPVQTPVVKEFGFDSVADSIEAFTGDLDADPEVFSKKCRLAELVGAGRTEPTGVPKWLGSLVSYHAGQSSALGGWTPQAPPVRRRGRNFSDDLILTRGPRSRSLNPARAERARSRAASCPSQRAASLTRFEDPLAPIMTKERAMAMHDAMIEGLSQPEFQEKLHVVLQATAADPVEQSRMRQKFCLPIENAVARKFGYENAADLLSTFPRKLRADPEIAAQIQRLNALVQIQGCCAAGPADVEHLNTQGSQMLALQKCSRGGAPEALLRCQPGRRWRVVGGCTKGGIIPRRGKELSSAQLGTRTRPSRLAFDAEVEELELHSERLHYRKISGDGPDFGWVSVLANGGRTLLEPMQDEMD